MARSRPDGFLAAPAPGTGPGVLVLHAWWGLNETLKTFCTRLADAGFTAFAPDLYRGRIADTIQDAEAFVQALDQKRAAAAIADATAFLAERGEAMRFQAGHAGNGAKADGGGGHGNDRGGDGAVGESNKDRRHDGDGAPGLAVIGFSLGANFALDLSTTDPEHIRSVVLFYGTGGGDFSRSRAAYLGHFAENDPFEPLSEVGELEASLRSAGRPVTFHRYNGVGHWFFEPDRVDAYDREAAGLAWDRTLAFLRQSSTR